MNESPFILEVTSPAGRLLTPLHAKKDAYMVGTEWLTGPALRPAQAWALNAWLDYDEASMVIMYAMLETPTTSGELTDGAWTLAKWRVTDERGLPVQWAEITAFFNPDEE